MDSVDGYVPAQIGEGRYIAHVTVGFATLEDLKSIETEPFNAFDVHPASVAVYHLGDSGAARKRRKAWPLAGLRRGDGRRAMAASRTRRAPLGSRLRHVVDRDARGQEQAGP